MVVVPPVGRNPGTDGGWRISWYRRCTGVCHAAAASLQQNVRKSGLSCIFGLCFGGVRKCSRNGGVSVADVPLSRVIDNRAAVSGKCHSKRQTARTTAVYSLYYHSIFFRNVPRKCFLEQRIFMHKQLRIFLKSAIVTKV